MIKSMFFVLLISLVAWPITSAAQTNPPEEMAQFAESMAKQAEEMAKNVQSQQKDWQNQLKEMESHIHKMMPQIEHNVQKSLAMMQNQLELNLQLPDLPDLPALPDMSNMTHFSRIGENFHGEIVSDEIEKTFGVAEGTPVKVDANFSSIRILPGENPSQIRVHITRKTGAETKAIAEKLLQNFAATAEMTDEGVEVKISFKEKKEENKIEQKNTMMQCDVEILAPPQTPVKVRNSFGDVTIQNMQSEIKTENRFGKTLISGAKGKLEASAEYGQLAIQSHEGPVQAQGKFGDVLVDKTNGDVILGVQYGKAKVSTDLKEAKIEGTCSFGKCMINLPRDYSGKIEAVASFSSIQAPDGLLKKKEMFKEAVEDAIGDGKGRIQIKSSYSPVEITVGKNIFEKAVEFSHTVTGAIDKAMGKDMPSVLCKGIVLDANTGSAIPNARIEAYYHNQPSYADCSTNEAGEYRLKVFSEEHNLKASAPGYKEKLRMVDTGFLQRRKEINVNFLLEPK